MKRPISLFLSLLVTMSTNLIASAYVLPTDIDNKCTNVYKLKSNKLIHLPNEHGKKVCGCKTCTVDAITYNKLQDYLDSFESNRLDPKNKNMINQKQKSINYKAAAVGSTDVALISSSVASTFYNLYPHLMSIVAKTASKTPTGLIICGIVTVGGIISGITFATLSGKHYTLFLQDRSDFENRKQILKSLSRQIEEKGFINNTFLFVSTNYDPSHASTYVSFENKPDITYDKKVYNEKFFDNLNKNIIKPAIKNFDDISTYNDESNYDYSMLNLANGIFKITLPTAVVCNSFSMLKAGYPEKAEEILSKVKGMSKDKAIAIIKDIYQKAIDTGYDPSEIAKETGQKFVDILLDSKSITSGKSLEL